MDLEGLVRPVVESSGLELVDVSFHRESGRRVLRITVDREGGVDLDAIADASERLSRRLDLEDVSAGPYHLEVSSPGLERSLRRPEEFARHVGEKVRLRTTRPVDGARTQTGALVGADDQGVTVDTESGRVSVAYGDIASARTVFEWGPGARSPGRKGKR